MRHVSSSMAAGQRIVTVVGHASHGHTSLSSPAGHGDAGQPSGLMAVASPPRASAPPHEMPRACEEAGATMPPGDGGASAKAARLGALLLMIGRVSRRRRCRIAFGRARRRQYQERPPLRHEGRFADSELRHHGTAEEGVISERRLFALSLVCGRRIGHCAARCCCRS